MSDSSRSSVVSELLELQSDEDARNGTVDVALTALRLRQQGPNGRTYHLVPPIQSVNAGTCSLEGCVWVLISYYVSHNVVC